MPVLTTNFPLTLSTGQKEYNRIFVDRLMALGTPSYDPFTLTTPGLSRIDWSEVAMTDLPRIGERSGPNADMEEITFEESYKKTYTVAEYAARFQVPALHWTLMDPAVKAQYPEQFAAASKETLEYYVWSALAGGFADTGPDGVSLFNNSHPLANGGTADNLGTAAFSKSALGAAIAAMARFPSPQGKETSGYVPSFVVVPPELKASALEVTRSNLQGSSTAFVDYNPFPELVVISSPYISESNDWMLLVNPMLMPKGMRLFLVGSGPQFLSGENSEEARHWGHVDWGMAVGYSSWRFGWGSTGGS